MKIQIFVAVWPLSGHFYFQKWPQKTLIKSSFFMILAKNPLFFLFNMYKKIINIYKFAKISGQMARQYFLEFFGKIKNGNVTNPIRHKTFLQNLKYCFLTRENYILFYERRWKSRIINFSYFYFLERNYFI